MIHMLFGQCHELAGLSKCYSDAAARLPAVPCCCSLQVGHPTTVGGRPHSMEQCASAQTRSQLLLFTMTYPPDASCAALCCLQVQKQGGVVNSLANRAAWRKALLLTRPEAFRSSVFTLTLILLRCPLLSCLQVQASGCLKFCCQLRPLAQGATDYTRA